MGKFVPKFDYVSNDDTESMAQFHGYFETKLGCGGLYSALVHDTYNQEGKIIRHVAISNDASEVLGCVGAYFAAQAEEKEL